MEAQGGPDAQVDPSVLSTFAPSVQYEMLLRMREQQQAANRARFQERAASAPQSFSVFQMQTFLKASSFRRAPRRLAPLLPAPLVGRQKRLLHVHVVGLGALAAWREHSGGRA